MTDETNTDIGTDDPELRAAALEDLKERATKLGIKFHPSIGEEKLREKVSEVLAEQDATEQATEETEAVRPAPAVSETTAQRSVRLKREASALVRVRVTNMNPDKREWEGEIFTASNSVVGTLRKYVHYNVPWHVPRIILNQLRQRQFQHFITETDAKGRKVRRGRLVPEFAIEELPPLSEKELKALAQRQAMAKGTSEE